MFNITAIKNSKLKLEWKSLVAPSARLVHLTLHFSFLIFVCRPVLADPTGLPAQHYRSGLAYERLGRLDEAYTELQLAFALDQDSTPVAVALGVVACRLGRLDIAQRALERSVTVDANSVASYYQLALLYEKKKMNDRALDSWQRFVALTQDDTLKAVAQKHIQYLESHDASK